MAEHDVRADLLRLRSRSAAVKKLVGAIAYGIITFVRFVRALMAWLEARSIGP